MARIRSVKPEFWTDEDLADLRRDARLLYMGLWNFADEHGRLRGDPRYVKGQVFPYDDDLTPEAIDGLLDELAGAKKVLRYRVGGRSFLFLPNLANHQRLEAEKVPSRLPGVDEAEPDPDDPARHADKSAPESDKPGTDLTSPAATVRADKSARGADSSSLLYGACSREQGAGGRETSAKPPRDEAPTRADVERICIRLADRIEANGAKRPAITKRWRDAARLMLDADHRAEADVLAAIDWCQDNEFWRANILSLPKLREKYDQLSLQAQRGNGGTVVHIDRRQQATNQAYANAMTWARTQDALEARGEP